jgi:hypothetical protein
LGSFEVNLKEPFSFLDRPFRIPRRPAR